MQKTARPITVIPGDGIGPEVVHAALRVVEAAGVPLDIERCEAGAKVFLSGDATGVPRETRDSIARTGVVLKGPLETPIGYGAKSANVTLRKLFETFGNIRPVRELPGVHTPFSGRDLDIVIVRENVEDLYAGVEHMQTPGVAQGLKLISRLGCEKIVRLAFEFAVSAGRSHVHCATKANILKLTEGMLQHVFEEIAPTYPDIEAKHILVDNCAHQLAMRPEQFDVIVTTNMNGDILSDLTSGLTGGLGFAPSANIGHDVAIFEAVHGSAPDIAGKCVANPTALILSAAMMLRRLGEGDAADLIEQAVVHTLRFGTRTADMAGSTRAASTTEYTDEVIANLGQGAPSRPHREYRPLKVPPRTVEVQQVVVTARRVVGVDVFIESTLMPADLGERLEADSHETPLRLLMISNRGTLVYPGDGGPVGLVDHYRCRFVGRDPGADVGDEAILQLLRRVGSGHRWMHIEKLQQFDGSDAFSKSQGQA
ncbi:MAG TPA: NADP-dependent isocitrate dehydrogenase [Gemmatimonadaceae bacterium]